jgi:hypothetical protein
MFRKGHGIIIMYLLALLSQNLPGGAENDLSKLLDRHPCEDWYQMLSEDNLDALVFQPHCSLSLVVLGLLLLFFNMV